MLRIAIHRSKTAVLAVFLLAFAVGCQPTAKPSEFTRDTGREMIPVQDNWRQFALSNYAGELLVELRTSTDVRFLQPVMVTATRDLRTGTVELLVFGELDQTNIQLNRLRHPFSVAWKQAGGRWEVIERDIKPGRTAPSSPRPLEPMPVPKPSTAPAA